jgi:hypothetical protein
LLGEDLLGMPALQSFSSGQDSNASVDFDYWVECLML